MSKEFIDTIKRSINGKLFCDWLIALYIQHRSCDPKEIIVPLLIWTPSEKSSRVARSMSNKSTRDGSTDDIKRKPLEQFDRRGFEVKSMDSVRITDVISKLQGRDRAMRRRPRS